jgi:putative glycerol-1-phosphate prenyltransferase
LFFSGNPSQISDQADAILFLSLISGRNPDYLIGHQVDAANTEKTNLEVISTGYMLIESGGLTAVAVSKTKPLSKDNIDAAVATRKRRDARE